MKIVIVGIVVFLLAAFVFVPGNTGMTVTSSGFLSVSSGIALADSPQIGDEVAEKRTRNSKTHWLGETSYSWDGTIGSIHYEDEGWQEIDNEFESATAPWDWQMLKAGYHIRVKNDFTAGQIIEFEKQGETVQFQPMALEWTNDLDMIQSISMPQNVAPTITNPEVDLLPAIGMPSHQGTIRWDDAYGEGLDFEWKCTSTRLVKILEVENFNKLPVPEQYILDGGNPVLRLNLIFDPSGVDIYVDNNKWNESSKVQTFDIIEFKKDGEVLWGFMPLRYWGSYIGSDLDLIEENEGQSVATLEKRGNKLYISIRVPHEWLQSAVYPVFIDTDVDVQVGANTDDCLASKFGTWPWDFSTNKVYIGAGYQGDLTKWQGSGLRFQTVSIANSATITTANMTIRCRYARYETAVNTYIQGEDVDDAATFSDFDNYKNRRGIDGGSDNTTTACVSWDDIPAWTLNDDYNSPEIWTVIKEIVDRDNWESGNDIVLFWDDHDDRSTHGSQTLRQGYSYEGSSSYAPKLHIEYSAGCTPDISNVPSSKVFGTVSASTSYWSSNLTPSWPLDDGECYFTVTNNSGGAVSITAEATNFTGGVGWTLGTPAENVARMKVGKSGDANEDAMVTLTTSPQAFMSGLADSATKKWEIKLETPTSFTDGTEKTSTVTLTATCD